MTLAVVSGLIGCVGFGVILFFFYVYFAVVFLYFLKHYCTFETLGKGVSVSGH